MGFYEDWHARQAQQTVERQRLIEEARQFWLGRRVWYPSPERSVPPVYGEVVSIDDAGRVQVVVGYDRNDQPRYWESDVALLGVSVTLAEG